MAATSSDFQQFQNLSLAGQYDSLNAKFNLLNAQFEKTLHKKEGLSSKEFAHQEENIKNELETLRHSLGFLSMQMEELIEKIKEESPIDASRYSLIQASVQTEVAKRANDLQAYLVPFFDKAPEDAKMFIFSLLPFEDLARASGVSTKWQPQSKEVFTARSKQEVEQVLAKAVTDYDTLSGIAYKLVLRGEISRAVEMLQKLPTEDEQSNALHKVTRDLVHMGKPELAIGLVNTFESPPIRFRALSCIIWFFFKQDNINRSHAIISELLEPERSKILSEFSNQLAYNGNLELAIDELMKIKIPAQAYIPGINITTLLVNRGQVDQAIELINHIPDERILKHALSNILIPAFLARDEFERAIDMAHRIQHAVCQCISVNAIFGYFKQKNMLDNARDLALQFPKTVYSHSLFLIAMDFTKNGSIEQAIQSLTAGGFHLSSEIQAHHLPLLLQQNEFEKAIEMALHIPDEFNRGSCFRQIFKDILSKGMTDRALGMMERFPGKWLLNRDLDSLAVAIAKSGKIEQAIAIAGKISLAYEREITLRAIEEIRIQSSQ